MATFNYAVFTNTYALLSMQYLQIHMYYFRQKEQAQMIKIKKLRTDNAIIKTNLDT